MTDFDWDTFETELDLDEYSNLSLDSFLDDEVEEVPEPSELHISTITATARIVSKDKSGKIILEGDDLLPINLQKLYENIPIDKEHAEEGDVNTLEKGHVLGIEYVDNKPRGYDRHNKRRKKKRKTVKKRNKFYNQSTLLIRMDDEHEVNLKLFRNGGVQMTGLKYEEEGIKCITEIIIPILENLGEIVIDKHFVNEKNSLHIDKYDIVMINSNYRTNFKIKRDVLHNILNKEYGILASFEPCIYPGVNAKYYWNKIAHEDKMSGVCDCKKKCVGKGRGNGDGDCKKITISTFQSGSVIITGARNTKQIYDAYNFINEVFRIHYSELKKREIKIAVPEPPVFKAKKKIKYTIKKIKKNNK